ncbi:TetR/AcrR family transcriptional regulator [Microbacterium foliorum]|uniref:HTH-type transcriptional regulator TtgR n=1 Tax=Microbacterium foliorum TaxID=104336 RepID=A0A0F0KFR6_9MICO|nr:TetR/AcrR family transcriptional regulator [Microbacterium foliorum]KJL19264.1 HTH-type transcriptional regulator TtgR [Microbacterium foliorum]
MADSRMRKPRGEYAKTRAKRAAILDAALDVFADSGYHSGSLRDVAERVGMSEAGLLHHFPNKPALLAAVLDRRDQHTLEWVRMAEGNGEVTLSGLVTTAVRNSTVPGIVELYCILSAEGTKPGHPAHEYFVTRYDVARTNLRRAFEDLQRQGRMRPGVTSQGAAVATLAMMDGLQVQWLLNPDVVDMAEELSRFFRAFVDIDLTPALSGTSGGLA